MSWTKRDEERHLAALARYDAIQKMTPNQKNRLFQYEERAGVLLTGEEIEKWFIPHGVFKRGETWGSD